MDFYGVPNLPGVQAGVSSGQTPHLSGANNESGDGFAQGFNSVINMEKQLSDKEWTKLIKQNTDAQGHINYAKVNADAAKDDLIKFGADHWNPIISNEQSKQLDRAAVAQAQRADIAAAFKRGLINSYQAQQALQNAQEKATSSAVLPEAGNVLDAGRLTEDIIKSQPQTVATLNDGRSLTLKGLRVGEDLPYNMAIEAVKIPLAEKVRLEHDMWHATDQNQHGTTEERVGAWKVTDDGKTTPNTIAINNTRLDALNKQFNNYMQTNSDRIPQLQNLIRTGNEGIKVAEEAIDHPEATSGLASWVNKILGGVQDFRTLSPLEEKKILSALNLQNTAHNQKELEEMITSNGGNAPAAITALAIFLQNRKNYQELVNRNIAKALGNVDDYNQGLNKWNLNFPDLGDYYQLRSLSPKAQALIRKGMSIYDPTFETRIVNAYKHIKSLEGAAQKNKDPRFKDFENYMQGSM